MEIGDELNNLGSAELSISQILGMEPNKTGWDVSNVAFKFKSKYWGFVAKDFVKTLGIESIAGETVQMVLVKTKSGQREMTITDAEDLGLAYELI